MSRQVRKPTYLLRKRSGQARVRIGGKDIYLGEYNSRESLERYDDLVHQWRAKHGNADRYTMTVDDLAIFYMDHARRHYRKNGRETSEVHCVKSTLRYLVAVAGTTRAAEFGPRMLKLVRERMIADGLARRTINSNIVRVRRVFKWAASEELIGGDNLSSLQAVDGLRYGRSAARETKPVAPVSQAAIDAVKPHVSRPVWGAIQLQLLTGMRSGEVLAMRACDINMTGSIWEYVPPSHKTEHHGHRRVIFLGPKSQEVVREFLVPDTTAHLFNPHDAIKTSGTVGDHYGRDAYRVAIRRACEVAFSMPRNLRYPSRGLTKLPEAERAAERKRRLAEAALWRAENCWFPHQLRHTAATCIRREAGIETARCVLGHSELNTTEIYAEADMARARDVMGKVG